MSPFTAFLAQRFDEDAAVGCPMQEYLRRIQPEGLRETQKLAGLVFEDFDFDELGLVRDGVRGHGGSIGLGGVVDKAEGAALLRPPKLSVSC